MKVILSYVFLVVFLSGFAATNAMEVAAKKVTCGMLINDIYDVDVTDQSFKADFHLWCISDDPTYDPRNSLEIINSKSSKVVSISTDMMDGKKRTVIRYHATLKMQFEGRYFPFEHNKLEILIEDTSKDMHKLIFVPDTKTLPIQKDVTIAEWRIIDSKVSAIPHLYKTSFGDPNAKGDTYSRIVFSVDIKRHGLRMFFNYFLGFFLGAFFALLSFFLRHSEADAYTNLILTAVLSATGNKFLIDKILPSSEFFTLADAVQMATFIVVGMSAFRVIISNSKWYIRLGEKGMIRIQQRTAYGLMIFYGISILGAVWWAMAA